MENNKTLPKYEKHKHGRLHIVYDMNDNTSVASFSESKHGKCAELLAEHVCQTGEILKNYYEYREDYVVIHAYSQSRNESFEAKIDPDQVEKCKKYAWYMSDHGNGRAQYFQATDSPNKRTVRLHRLVMEQSAFEEGFVDHINGDGLDNRKCNLRVVDARSNSLNRTKLNLNNTSGASGVHRRKDRNGWQAEWMDKASGNKRSKLFKDVNYGGSDGAFEAAKAYRAQMVATNHQSYIDDNTK